MSYSTPRLALWQGSPTCRFNGRILLANLLQSSRSTLSRGSFLSFLVFKEGMLSTPISILGGWPTVSGRFLAPKRGLANHLIRLEEERRGHGQVERLGGLEVDDELELCGLLYREVIGLGTSQD